MERMSYPASPTLLHVSSPKTWYYRHAAYLDTSMGQVAAQRLYTSCDYAEVGHIAQSGVECVLYEKNLA